MALMNQWQCPYCGARQVLSAETRQARTLDYAIQHSAHLAAHNYTGIALTSQFGPVGLYAISTACMNPECNQLTLEVQLQEATHQSGRGGYVTSTLTKPLQSWRLLPESMAKPQPEYIPAHIRQDYEEACRILNLSPKASATLARRCLQGMIRDFCEISERTLYEEIDALQNQFAEGKPPYGIDPESIKALDDARKIGNIGAHMEPDVISDVGPDEAASLIDLIETLFADWYVTRHERHERYKQLRETTETKEQQIADAKAKNN